MKTFPKIMVTLIGSAFLASPVLAATDITFSPASIKANQGQNFILSLYVDPAGKPNYTAKVELNFPADLVQFKGFTFGSGWFPLSQPGYDLVDNQKGAVIKTAGYPGGISKLAVFGTATFQAKKSGQGQIKVGPNSMTLDINNGNVIKSPIVPVSLTINAPAPAPAPAPKPAAVQKPVAVAQGPAVERPAPAPASIVKEAPVENQGSFLATIGSAVSFGTDNVLVGVVMVLVTLILLAIGAYYHYIHRKGHQITNN